MDLDEGHIEGGDFRRYPQKKEIRESVYRFERILKDDIFSVNVLYKNEKENRYVLKLSDFRFLGGYLLRPLAAWMSRHEHRVYKCVDRLEGVPRLGPREGARGYWHEYVEGKTLHELEQDAPPKLPRDFFERLLAILQSFHERHVVHIDTNKRGNILVQPDGSPCVLDYQVSLHLPARRGSLGALNTWLFTKLVTEDVYHVFKHKRDFLPDCMTDEERSMATRSHVGFTWLRTFAKFYRVVKRKIYPKGSNETIWYRWRKEKDKSGRMP
ncbi:MAG: hypothetical protein KAI66_22120 [Lentisphaeria bacterium]|nr:hypothetical protein [Lentisphaeria bacterium]